MSRQGINHPQINRRITFHYLSVLDGGSSFPVCVFRQHIQTLVNVADLGETVGYTILCNTNVYCRNVAGK